MQLERQNEPEVGAGLTAGPDLFCAYFLQALVLLIIFWIVNMANS